MKKTTLTILLMAMTAFVFGQISTTKVTQKTDQVDNTYDSTENFLGKNVYKYVGQELYLIGKVESSRKYGYAGFSIDSTKEQYLNKSNTYKCCDSYNSKYDELAGKYFEVLEIIKHPRMVGYFYLKLKEKGSGDIVYFEYNSKSAFSFPFIVVGFFEKQKKILIGQKFVFADKIVKYKFWGETNPKPLSDINTGKYLTIITGDKWKCVDLTIEEKYYTLSLVVQNSLGEKTTMEYENVFGELSYNRTYTSVKADDYRKKFGSEYFDIILKNKVKIGMTKEMCKLSWGKPESINETITSGNKSEQWVYSDNYLYFDNGILTAIQ